MPELKPCPFCGCDDVRKITTVFDCTIFCAKCRGSIHRENYIKRDSIAETLKEAEPEAIEAWNRRAEDSGEIDFDYSAED